MRNLDDSTLNPPGGFVKVGLGRDQGCFILGWPRNWDWLCGAAEVPVPLSGADQGKVGRSRGTGTGRVHPEPVPVDRPKVRRKQPWGRDGGTSGSLGRADMDADSPDSPEDMLDALRGPHHEDEEARDAQLVRIVERFPADRLREAVRGRLRELGGLDGEAILRLVEAYATPELLGELARALEDQPDLAPDRAWEALTMLDGAGMLEAHPLLAERWDELNDSFEADDALDTLVEQLEEEPEGSWVALQGLGAVEPEVRAQIIGGLADFPTGPGLIAFLRLLTFAIDPTTRSAALGALAGPAELDDEHRFAWAEIAHDHPDPEVRDRAIRLLGPDPDGVIAEALERPGRARPQAVGNLVTALDGEGQGSILVASRDRGRWIVAKFFCDVWRGIVSVIGQVDDDPSSASGLFGEMQAREDRDFIENAPGLAEGLLAGAWMLCGPETNPVLRYWLERTVGPGSRPGPFAGLVRDEELASHALDAMDGPIRLILDACPDWVDASDLTYDLAEEVALRSGDAPPDPLRDAGAYRYLFEHRLLGRLEHYRRMLLWMASFWQASGNPILARSALTLAWQLSDPQHAVPAHPFTVELTTRSLIAAREDIRSGRDPRPH